MGWRVDHYRTKIHADQDSIRTEHHYDNNGLLIQIDRNGEITGYTYDTNVKSRIKSISIAGRHNQAFTYDKLGRITEQPTTYSRKYSKLPLNTTLSDESRKENVSFRLLHSQSI